MNGLFCYFRYVELNTKLQAAYRSYNPGIPSYLIERPHHIINHCLDRLYRAESIPRSHVDVIDITKGVFSVRRQSSTEEKDNYKVMFGTTQPSCDCQDWERHRLPCKHFCAVFLHVPLWSFDKLPDAYKDSPFFTLDGELFTPDNPKANDYIRKGSADKLPSMIGVEAVEVNDGKESLRFEDLPRTVPRPRTSAAKCREVLGQIKNMTYIVEAWENGEILDQLREKLEECLHLLQLTAPKENGVILEAPRAPKATSNAVRKRKLGKKQTKLDFKSLPVPKKKNPYAGRSGERAHQMKKRYNASLLEMEGRPAKQAKLCKDDEDTPKMPDIKTDATKDPFVTSARTNTCDVKAAASNILDGIEAPMKFADSKAATTKIPTCKAAPPRTPDVNAAKTSILDAKEAPPRTPDVKAAKTSIPDAKEAPPRTPDVKAATTSIPDVKAATTTPDVEATTLKTPDPKATATNSPHVNEAPPKAPDVKAATAKTPDDKAATPKNPDGNTATTKAPYVKEATAKTPDVEAATFKAPDVNRATNKTPDAKPAAPKTSDVEASSPKTPDVKADATAGPPLSTSISTMESDCEVTFVGRTNGSVPKKSRFLLGEQDIKIITSGEWLTDHIIGAAHSVLRSQFPYVKGLENTTLGPIYNFSVQKGEFAQILHTGSHHWILVSNIGCSNQSEVKLYDSLFRGRIPIFVKKQIASLLHEESRSFKIIVPDVQRQNNYDDCGVFAIAFLVSLLHGLDPSNLTFDSAAMRRHLFNSLSMGFFYPFPLSKVQEKRYREAKLVQKVHVICECRMPWDNADKKFPSLWCAECDSCKEWYHRKCVPGIPHAIFKGSNATWLCPKCEQALKQAEVI